MRKLTVLCVGRLKEAFYIDAAAEYVKRLSRYAKTDVIEIPEIRLPERPSPAQIQSALRKEADALQAKIPPSATTVALCIEGKTLSSERFADTLSDFYGRGDAPVFLIGGSYGLHDSIKDGASFRLSMSPMTFPHHLARVMLLEQLYRAFQINAGGRYHK